MTPHRGELSAKRTEGGAESWHKVTEEGKAAKTE